MSPPRLFDRAIIRLSPTEEGEDVRDFLQGLVTQDCKTELPLWAGLLTPQGKALFDFFLWADGDDVLIDCEAEHAEALVRRASRLLVAGAAAGRFGAVPTQVVFGVARCDGLRVTFGSVSGTDRTFRGDRKSVV